MVVKHWNKFSMKTVDTPFLEVSKARLDGALSDLT